MLIQDFALHRRDGMWDDQLRHFLVLYTVLCHQTYFNVPLCPSLRGYLSTVEIYVHGTTGLVG